MLAAVWLDVTSRLAASAFLSRKGNDFSASKESFSSLMSIVLSATSSLSSTSYRGRRHLLHVACNAAHVAESKGTLACCRADLAIARRSATSRLASFNFICSAWLAADVNRN